MAYLCHHGVKGQKWGVHNGPPYPIKAQKENPFHKQALTNIKGARMSNVDKWGQDASHNCLYIFGLSGSGKSTTALGLAKNSDSVIHLDCYIEPDSDDRYKPNQDESFNRYLDKNVPKWRELAKSVQRDGSSKIEPYSKEYWDIADSFRDAIESFSIQEFRKGNKVACEGVQMLDDWWGEKGDREKYFKDRPIIVLKPDKFKAMQQGEMRDNDRNLLQAFFANPQQMIERSRWYNSTVKEIKEFENSIHAKKGKKYVNDILRTIGSQTI